MLYAAAASTDCDNEQDLLVFVKASDCEDPIHLGGIEKGDLCDCIYCLLLPVHFDNQKAIDRWFCDQKDSGLVLAVVLGGLTCLQYSDLQSLQDCEQITC